jgi:hypothetical protein
MFNLSVVDYNGKIYGVVHRLQSILKVMIHLGLHKQLMVHGKCRVFMDETRRLITKEVDPTPDVNIFVISLSVSKTFLTTYIFNDSGDGLMNIVTLTLGSQLRQWLAKV